MYAVDRGKHRDRSMVVEFSTGTEPEPLAVTAEYLNSRGIGPGRSPVVAETVMMIPATMRTSRSAAMRITVGFILRRLFREWLDLLGGPPIALCSYGTFRTRKFGACCLQPGSCLGLEVLFNGRGNSGPEISAVRDG